MSEYNIQMNKYNAINDGYDQLYPQPMKHANTHAKDGNDPITPSMIGTYNKTEIDKALQNKQDKTKPSQISIPLKDGLSGDLIVWKTQDGEVSFIAGIVKQTAFSSWESICTMPEGYRPINQKNYLLYSPTGGIGTISFDANGTVYINSDIAAGITTLRTYGRFVSGD